jgi:hypothetical protein
MMRTNVSRGMSAPRSRPGAVRAATLTLPSLTVAILFGVAVFAAATYPTIRLAQVVEGGRDGSDAATQTLGAAGPFTGLISSVHDAFANTSGASSTNASPAGQAGVTGQTGPRPDAWGTAVLAQIAQTEIVANSTTAGPRDLELRAAEEKVAAARLTLQHAQADQQLAANSPEAVALRAAGRELASAQNVVTSAQQELQQVSAPNPVMLEAADREVQRAQATLRILRTTRPPRDDPEAQSGHAEALAAAQVTLDDAMLRRDRLRAGPEPQQIERARQTLAAAQQQFEDARQRYGVAAQAAPLPDLDAADAGVLAARRALYDAEAALQALQSATTQGQAVGPQDGASSPGT